MSEQQEAMPHQDVESNDEHSSSSSCCSSSDPKDESLSSSSRARSIVKKRQLIDKTLASLKSLEKEHERQMERKSIQVDADYAWRSVSTRKRKQKELVLLALRSDKLHRSMSWEYFNDCYTSTIINDREVLLTRLKHVPGLEDCETSPIAIKKLHNDKRVMIELCRRHSKGLEWASKTLKNNEEVVLAAVSKNPLALRYASPKMQNNRKVAKTALGQENGIRAFKFLSKKLQKDYKLAHLAILNAGEAYAEYNEHLSDLPQHFREDEDIVLDAVKLRGSNLRFVTDSSLLRDLEIVQAACRQDSTALAFVPECRTRTEMLQGDNLLMLVSNGGGGELLEEAPFKYRFDSKYVLSAVKNGYTDRSIGSFYTSPNSRDFFFKVVEASNNICDLYRNLPEEVREEKEVILALLRNDTMSQGLASKLVEKHGDIEMKDFIALIQKGLRSILQCLDEGQLGDKWLFLHLCSVDGSCLEYANKELKKDTAFVMLSLNSEKPITMHSVMRLPEEIWSNAAIVERIVDLADEQGSSSVIERKITSHILQTNRGIFLKCLEKGWPRGRLAHNYDLWASWRESGDHGVNMAMFRFRVRFDTASYFHYAARGCSTREELEEAIAIDPRVLGCAKNVWKFDHELMVLAISSSRKALQAYDYSGSDLEHLLDFATRVRRRKIAGDAFVEFLTGIAASCPPPHEASLKRPKKRARLSKKRDKSCALSLLNVGGVTGLALKKLIGEYAGIPMGKEYKMLRSASDNLEFWGY